MSVLKSITNTAPPPRGLEAQLNSPPQYSAQAASPKIALPTLDGVHFEKTCHIISLEAKGNYTCLHFKAGHSLLISKTLREMDRQLKNERQFVRIHRSFTINLDYLTKYWKGKGGIVQMENGAHFNVSCGRKQAFLKSIELYFGCSI